MAASIKSTPTSAADLPVADVMQIERGEADSFEPPVHILPLRYPFKAQRPAPGELVEVRPGVFWLRMPLPMSLNHINLYVLDDGDSWVIVDTGLKTPETRAAWEMLFAGPLAGKPVSRIILTHFHPDHAGQAGWLSRLWDAPVLMSRAEYFMIRMLVADVREEPPESMLALYARCGWGAADIEAVSARGWGRMSRAVTRLPDSYVRIRHGEEITIGGRIWRAVEGSGHSPEHMCLLCEEAGVLISGDQVLPQITPNVSVYPTEPDGNPLAEWFTSLEALLALDADLLVLPAHGDLFHGLHDRLRALRADHERKLAALAAFCTDQPRLVTDCFPSLFRKAITNDDMMMATGEALAHIRYLEVNGRLKRLSDEAMDRFLTIAAL